MSISHEYFPDNHRVYKEVSMASEGERIPILQGPASC